MYISVVIPTFNEGERIAECLDALMKNTQKPFEIIIADGGSQDKTVAIASAYKGVDIIYTPKKTAAESRNLGIEKAKGDIIAFTDGDCIVDAHWLEQIATAFEKYDIDGLGGHVEPAPAYNEIEEYWGNLSLRIIMNFGEVGYEVMQKTLNDAFITANCAYKKELLHAIGGFDVWFANNAEDIDLCWRSLNSGARLRYVPEVRIQAHSITTLDGIKKKSMRNGISSSKLQKRYGRFINYDWNIYRMLAANIRRRLRGEKNASYDLTELTWHLLGKYYGSIIAGVINI